MLFPYYILLFHLLDFTVGQKAMEMTFCTVFCAAESDPVLVLEALHFSRKYFVHLSSKVRLNDGFTSLSECWHQYSKLISSQYEALYPVLEQEKIIQINAHAVNHCFSKI